MNQTHQSNAGAPVATFEGYVEGKPLVKWLDRANMPPAGTKLFTEGAQIARALGADRGAALAEAAALLPSLMTGTLKRDGLSEEFLNGMAYGLGSYCSAIKTLADPSRVTLVEGECGASDARPSASTAPESDAPPITADSIRLPADDRAALASRPTELDDKRQQDLRDLFDLAWNQALSDAALYVASHCALEEHHVEHILELVPPKLRVRGFEIASRSDEVPTLAPEASVRAAFVEWHQDEFGYCCVDEKSFTDGDLQAVAWAAWKEAHARSGVMQANGEIA